jgi:hypothetical protein
LHGRNFSGAWLGKTSPSQLNGHWLYGPDVLGILNQAFDDDWAEKRNTFADDPLAVQRARN